MRRALILALLLVAPLAGCGAPDGDAADPPPRVVSRAPTPPVRDPARLHVAEVAVEPNETEIGSVVLVRARIVNTGDLAGQGVVAFEVVGGARVSANVLVEPRGSNEVRANLTPENAGDLAVRVTLGDETMDAPLKVRGARVANLTFEARAVAPCGAVDFAAGFDNVGDAPAREVRLAYALADDAGALVAQGERTLADVPAGERASWAGTLEGVQAACAGEPEPRSYAVRFTVQARGLLDAELRGVVAP